MDGDDCTLTTVDGPNVFINRFVEVGDQDANVVLNMDCFNSCDGCLSSINELPDGAFVEISPTVVSQNFTVNTNVDDLKYHLYSMDGRLVASSNNLRSGMNEIMVDGIEQGIYIVHLYKRDINIIEKIIIRN